jgi:hypothetical protein
MRILFLFCFALPSFAQRFEPFQGKIVYSITVADTAMKRFVEPKTMVIYTNDTIVRIENETPQLGKQVVIKHTVLNKSILLLQNGNSNYAIQTDLSKSSTSQGKDSTKPVYVFKKKLGKKRILEYKANRMTIRVEGQKETMEILYLKKFSPKYIDAYKEVPGLPVFYSLNSSDGPVLYTLIYMEETKLNRDLFGVPSDYKKVSFDEFLDEVLDSKK